MTVAYSYIKPAKGGTISATRRRKGLARDSHRGAHRPQPILLCAELYQDQFDRKLMETLTP